MSSATETKLDYNKYNKIDFTKLYISILPSDVALSNQLLYWPCLPKLYFAKMCYNCHRPKAMVVVRLQDRLHCKSTLAFVLVIYSFDLQQNMSLPASHKFCLHKLAS